MSLLHAEDKARQRVIFRLGHTLRIGDHEIKLVVELDRRDHLHDLLGEEAITGQEPLDVLAVRRFGKACAPARCSGRDDGVRHGKLGEHLLQLRPAAHKIERDDLAVRICLLADMIDGAPPKGKIAEVRHDDAHEFAARQHTLLREILRELLGEPHQTLQG